MVGWTAGTKQWFASRRRPIWSADDWAKGNTSSNGDPRKTILLLGALGSTAEGVVPIGRAAHKRFNATVRTRNLPGHNGVEEEFHATTLEYSQEMVEQWFLELWEEVQYPIWIGGISGGGGLSVPLARRHPDKVAGVMAWSLPLELQSRYIRRARDLFLRGEEVLPSRVTEILRRRLRVPNLVSTRSELMTEALSQLPIFRRLNPIHISQWKRLQEQVAEDIHHLRCPVFLGFSTKDEVIDPSYVDRLPASLRVKPSRIELYNNSPHHLPLGPESDRVIGDALDFLAPFMETEEAAIA